MAIAGGATVAYRCRIVDGKLYRDKDTAMKTVPPLPAIDALLRGETVIVAGADVVAVARLVELEQTIIELRSMRNGLDEL